MHFPNVKYFPKAGISPGVLPILFHFIVVPDLFDSLKTFQNIMGISKSHPRSLQIKMAAFRPGDSCSEGGDKDLGDLNVRHFPMWSPHCGSNGGAGRVGGRVHCRAIISSQS